VSKARQTFERRQLGLTLRRLREAAGKSQQAAAEWIGKARSQLVEMEDGRGTLAADKLETLLDFYGVGGEERTTVLELGALARARQKRRAYTDLLPGSFQRFADLEGSATEINCYEFGIIPGLLQSLGYVRATIDDGHGIWWQPSRAELEERISFRLDRQEKTFGSAERKTFRFVITEDALTGAVGGRDVMREQRRHILKLLESNDDLTVQVLPSNTYGNPARGAGLTILLFGDKGPPVGFSTVVFGPSTYFDQESDTAALLRGFHRLQELALDPDESVRLIRRIDEEADHA
jgi:transcriptional regulator with XRE-family HTH domain